MTKKALTLALAAAMAVSAVMTGCGSNGGSGGKGTDLSKGLKAVSDLKCKSNFVISICGATLEDGINSTTGQPAEGLNTLAKNQMKEKFPQVDVEFVSVPWDNASAKMQTILMSGGTDLFTQGGAFQPEYYKEGLSQDLTPFLEADTEFKYEDNFPANFRTHQNCTSYDGKALLTLPWAVGYRLIIYDAEIFDQWGVEYLSDTPTPEEVLEKAAKMTGTNPVTGKQNYGLWYSANTLNMSYLIPLCEYYGATECTGSWDDQANLQWSMDTDEYAKAVQWLIDAAEYVPDAATTGGGAEMFGTADNDIAIALDQNGGKMTALITQDPSQKDYLTGKFIPTMHFGKNGGNWTPCDGMGMASQLEGDDAQMAWHLLKYMTCDAAQWQEDNWGPAMSPNLGVQAGFPDWDIWRKKNAEVAAQATHPGYEINPFFQATIQPTLASMMSKAIAGETVDVKAELADLNKKAQDWSASKK
ncbi:MAG: extracellular solute-binding protein [Oscillospiraceae bacterium]|nr:extracellular solute-binding protein [Oscillospiraceae bacterium]